jgi:hypothetical protein
LIPGLFQGKTKGEDEGTDISHYLDEKYDLTADHPVLKSRAANGTL